MSCHENELREERLYEEFIENFEAIDEKVREVLNREVGDEPIPLVCAVLAKQLVGGCKNLGENEEGFVQLMRETWNSFEVEEIH
jgi:hypothetical protein